MNFIFAPDSFKGSLSAIECCDILEKVTARIFPGAETLSIPVADGGEGTVDALLRAMGGKRMETELSYIDMLTIRCCATRLSMHTA